MKKHVFVALFASATEASGVMLHHLLPQGIDGSNIPRRAEGRDRSPMFGATPAVEDGFIHFAASQPVFTFASVVDDGTGDQFFVIAEDETGEVKPLP